MKGLEIVNDREILEILRKSSGVIRFPLQRDFTGTSMKDGLKRHEARVRESREEVITIWQSFSRQMEVPILWQTSLIE